MDRTQYQRHFYMLRELDEGFSTGSGSSGFVKIEVREGKGRLHFFVQNLKEAEQPNYYSAYILRFKRDEIKSVCVGKVDIQKSKGELIWEFDPNQVGQSGYSIEEFNVFLLRLESHEGGDYRLICPMAGAAPGSDGWREAYKAYLSGEGFQAGKGGGKGSLTGDPAVGKGHARDGKAGDRVNLVGVSKAQSQFNVGGISKAGSTVNVGGESATFAGAGGTANGIGPEQPPAVPINKSKILEYNDAEDERELTGPETKPAGLEYEGTTLKFYTGMEELLPRVEQEVTEPEMVSGHETYERQLGEQGMQQDEQVKGQQEMREWQKLMQQRIEQNQVQQQLQEQTDMKQKQPADSEEVAFETSEAYGEAEDRLPENPEDTESPFDIERFLDKYGEISSPNRPLNAYPENRFMFEGSVEWEKRYGCKQSDYAGYSGETDKEEAKADMKGAIIGTDPDKRTGDAEVNSAGSPDNEKMYPAGDLDAGLNKDAVAKQEPVSVSEKAESAGQGPGGDNQGSTGGSYSDNANVYGTAQKASRDSERRESINMLEKVKEALNRHFEEFQPFDKRKNYYRWWKVNNPVYLNNVLYMNKIKSPIFFNPLVIMAHFKNKHIIMGTYYDRQRRKEYIVCGIPGYYGIDDRPFGSLSRWMPKEGDRPRYGGFGYWVLYIDPDSGKFIAV